jgi:hypothetical protein
MALALRSGPLLRANPTIAADERRSQWEWYRLHPSTVAVPARACDLACAQGRRLLAVMRGREEKLIPA